MGLLDRILSEFDRSDKPKDRPIVTLSYAQSLDGSIAARRGAQLQISGEGSAIFTHQLRAVHDCILVGVGTVLADDPRLTVRLVEGEDPQPVILDSALRTPVDAALVKAGTPWIATTNKADPMKVEALSSQDVKLLHFPTDDREQVNIRDMLEYLHQKGKRRVMVEGGAEVISSFIIGQLVDYMILTISPIIVGGLPAVQIQDNISGLKSNEFPRLAGVLSEYAGEDLIVFGKVAWPEETVNKGE